MLFTVICCAKLDNYEKIGLGFLILTPVFAQKIEIEFDQTVDSPNSTLRHPWRAPPGVLHRQCMSMSREAQRGARNSG
jgi:hypothetical protein